MSKCIIYMNINGKRLELPLENSDASVLIDNSVVEALQENPEALNTLIDNLRLSSNADIAPIQLKDIQKNGILANCTTEFIRNLPEYSDIRFPDVNANILLVDSLKIGGVPMYGRTIDSNGDEIFIVKNTYSDVIKLANYLSIKDAIQNGAVLDENSKYYYKLKELYDKKNKTKYINKLEDIILAYLQNKESFKSLSFSDGSSVIQFMENLTRTLQNYSLPKSYNSPIVTELNYRKKWLGNKEISITYNDLYDITKQYLPNLLKELNINNYKDFTTLLKENSGKIAEAINKLDSNLNIQEENNAKALYQYIVQGEPDFDYNITKLNDKKIILKSDFTPISDKYDISYNTIASMNSEDYRGYTIYNNGQLYFISRGSLLETSTRKPFNSLKEAKSKIDEIIGSQIIKDNSFIEFMFRDNYIDNEGKKHYSDTYSESIESRSRIQQNQVIGILDIPIDNNTVISGNESWLLNGNYTINDFYKIIDSFTISDTQKKKIKNFINTPQKVAAYIYKINELLGTDSRNSGKKLYDIANEINEAKTNYYYVEGSKGFKGVYKYKLIKTDLNKISEYKPNKSYPSIQWFNSISTVLNDEFGVQVHIIPASEIKENYKGVADPNTDKAFIYNGEVYINSSIASSNDLLHEYTHLILGIIKSNPNLTHNYEELVRGIYYSKEGRIEANRIRDAYPELSEMDVMEEVFCNLFSGYIRKRINKDTESIFKGSEEELKQYTSNIFNTPIISFEDFYSKSISSVFGKFKKEISYMLQHENIDFGSTKETRQITNWISKQIKEGNITENC